MSDKILHKRSLTSGSIPTTSSLDVGEIALNVPDGKIYIHKSSSQGESIESAITSNTISSIGVLLLSGSLILSGSTEINSGNVLDVSAENVFFDFNSLSFSGSTELTGSLIVTDGITGSLFGTASWAQNAITASYALNGGSGGAGFPYSGSAVITGSLEVTNGITGSLSGTASYAQTASYVLNAVSSSFATTASYALSAGGGTSLGSVIAITQIMYPFSGF